MSLIPNCLYETPFKMYFIELLKKCYTHSSAYFRDQFIYQEVEVAVFKVKNKIVLVKIKCMGNMKIKCSCEHLKVFCFWWTIQ